MSGASFAGISLTVDRGEFRSVAGRLALSEGAIKAALRLTLYKTARWCHTQIARQVRQEAGIPAGVLKRRLRAYNRPRGQELAQKIWFGLWEIPAGRLVQTPRQVKRGARAGSVVAGKHVFPNAFLMSGRSYQKIMRRTAAGLEEVMVNFTPQAEAAMSQAAQGAEERLKVIGAQELNYQLLKLLGRAR